MRILWPLCLVPLAVTGKPVPELGLDNLESTLKAHLWTCVLFYDRANERLYQEHYEMMSQLDDAFADDDRVGLAMMDVRANPYYRAQYKFSSDPDPFLQAFYSKFPTKADDLKRVNHRSFMNLKGDLYWPTRLSLFSGDFNVYGEIDLDFHADVEARVGILHRWIEPTIVKHPRRMTVLLGGQIYKETKAAEQNSKADNTFTFDEYFANLDQPTVESDRFLVESGTDNESDPDQGYYKYDMMTTDAYSDSEDWLDALSEVIVRYLDWVEGYETTWSEERRAREDARTNFGAFLQLMNDRVQNLIDRIFLDPTYTPPETKGKARRAEIPVTLRPYLQEMVMGYARSPSSLRDYLRGVSDTLGATPEERRKNRKTLDGSQFALFQRMREYMKLVEETTRVDDLYIGVLADLTSNWHNILVEFQENIHGHYVNEFLPEHPEENIYQFTRKPIEVIDMEDPANVELLSNYDEFNQRYTLSSVPVILGNVNMTNEVYTLEYLVEQCGAMDVTSSIKVSNPVGEKSASGWGGLGKYKLPEDLMSDSRIEVTEDEDGNEETEYDRHLTLQQFVILSEKLGNLYLHDVALPDECDRILYETTVYGEQQKFRIPSVIAAYDIFNRATLYNYDRSWPSLFIGKKGSNSKVHIDSGASGFFMYLVSGRKRWIVYNPTERPFLYNRLHKAAYIPDVLGMDKSEEANENLSTRFPLMHRAEDVYEVVQEPGQLIYIPPNSPHAVENLDDIVGVALNMGPREGLASHFHDQIHDERKFGYFELGLKYWLFEDNGQKAVPTKDPLYMTFGEYKAQY